MTALVRLLFAAVLLVVFAPSQNTVRIALNCNFNGIAHQGETNAPDAPNGFRAISDRALDFTAGVPVHPLFARFDVVASPGVLDMVHLGNRNTVDGGSWAFEATANGNNVGVQPAWLPNPNQTGPQITVLANPIAIGLTSSASVLFQVSNGGGSMDVTFGFQSGQSHTATISAPDWFGGPHAGRQDVDAANPGSGLQLTESIIDLSANAGETLIRITFGNRSNQNAGYGIYGVNVEAAPAIGRVNRIALNYNYNGIVHAGESLMPDAQSGYRSIADRGLDFQNGVPSNPLLAGFDLVAAPGVLDLVLLGNRNTVAGGTLAFDPVPDGDDIGVQPSWLAQVDLTGPQTTSLSPPILLDAASTASFLYQTTNGGAAFDVTFTLLVGSVSATLRGADWVGGSFLGTGNVDRALPGLPLRIESATVDLTPLAGFVLTAITFSNSSNPSGSCAVLAANVTGCLACANQGGPVGLGGGDGPTMTTTSTGALGCPLEWTVAGLLPNAPFGLFALGLGSTSLPLAIVFPGCTSTVHVPNPATASALVSAAGTATLTLPLAADPAFCGLVVTGQYVQLVAGPCPLLLSDALSITIGN